VQRRRRSKAVPRDIFGNPTTPSSTPKPASKNPSPPSPKPPAKPAAIPPAKPPAIPPAKPAAIPPAKPPAIPPKEPEPEVPEPVIEDAQEDVEVEVINEQILRAPRKSIGLRPQTEDLEPETQETVSNRAQEIIEESKERAKTVVVTPKPAKETVAKAPTAPKPKPRPRRSKSSSFQPANRAKRLDRSRHMEYKYEMRGLLDELNIPDEHRSNILGTIWARGERQTAIEAKQFISEKCQQGVLTEEQESTLKSVVDRYTVRR